MTEAETEEIARRLPVETGPHGMARRDIHAERPEGDLADVRGHQRPDAVPLPREGHADAGIAHEVAGDVDGDEETKAQLPRQERLADSVETVDGEQEGNAPQDRLDLGDTIEPGQKRGADPDHAAEHEAECARNGEGHPLVQAIELLALHDGGTDAEL